MDDEQKVDEEWLENAEQSPETAEIAIRNAIWDGLPTRPEAPELTADRMYDAIMDDDLEWAFEELICDDE